ncbi:MAG: prepilin-type N-terminal cleavage/methylation domain-containing protein [Phycisphaerae bacterium]
MQSGLETVAGRRVSGRGKGGGFTLIELLVVVAIIAVLIAILIPSLSKARDRAKIASCLSNLRQMSIAYQMYASDANNGHNVYDNNKMAGAFWMYQIQPYVGANNLRNLGLTQTTAGPLAGNVFVCPAGNLMPAVQNPSGGTRYQWGDATHGWDTTPDTGWWDKAVVTEVRGTGNAKNPDGLQGYSISAKSVQVMGSGSATKFIGYKGSYGINDWVDVHQGNPGTKPPGFTQAMNLYSQIEQPQLTPLFIDAIWPENDVSFSGSIGKFNEVVPGNGPIFTSPYPTTNIFTGEANTPTGRLAVARHGKSTNVAYCDGSASNLKLQEIWHLQWYNGSQPKDLSPADLQRFNQ